MRFILFRNPVKLACQVFQVVAKSHQSAKSWQRAHLLLVDQTTTGTLEAQRAQCPYYVHVHFKGLSFFFCPPQVW